MIVVFCFVGFVLGGSFVYLSVLVFFCFLLPRFACLTLCFVTLSYYGLLIIV